MRNIGVFADDGHFIDALVDRRLGTVGEGVEGKSRDGRLAELDEAD